MENFEQLGQEIGQLVDSKNKGYGGIQRVTDVMLILYPNGISVKQMPDALLIVRMLDKINRITGGDKRAFEENPYKDLAGYGLLGHAMFEQEKVDSKLTEKIIEKCCRSCSNKDNDILGNIWCSFDREKQKFCIKSDYCFWEPIPEVTE